MRSSLAFCAISISEAIDLLLLAAERLRVLGGRHYKGWPNARTLTEVKTKSPAQRGLNQTCSTVRLARRDFHRLGESLPAAEARMHRHRPALADLHRAVRSEEHTSELQSHSDLVCRLL